MDSNQKFWITIWSIIGAVLITLIISIAYYNISTNRMIFENGYDEVPCQHVNTHYMKHDHKVEK